MGPQELEFEIHISYIVETIHINSNVSLNCNFNTAGARIKTGFNSDIMHLGSHSEMSPR